MDVFRSLDEVDRARVAGGTLTIGNFDGVHLGHQRLVGRARTIARPAVVMTFEPHPMAVLNPRQAPPAITPTELRIRLLAEAGADAVAVARTDVGLLGLDPEQFVRTVVAERFAPRAMVEGAGFGFGRGRAGDTDTLRDLGRRFGFEVEVVEGVTRLLPGHHEPSLISSTLIRRLISAGNVEAAAECLGRSYRLVGRHVAGCGRGRQIGIPTINLATGEQLLPSAGIYAGRAFCEALGPRGSSGWPAAINVGPAPTFGQFQTVVEAHLLDFSDPVQAGEVELELTARLRGVEKFDSADELVAQIRRDIERVRELVN